MQLLVSVRSAEEVKPALAGGADIIDAKEPARGALGAVSLEVLIAIAKRIPSHVPWSMALGDVSTASDALTQITAIPPAFRRAPTYIKLGFAGISSAEDVGTVLSEVRSATEAHPLAPRVIAVAYADAELAASPAPGAICRAAAQAGVAGILFDTGTKDGGSLLQWFQPEALSRLITSARHAGLLTAVAGGLGAHDLGRVAALDPDIVGFRGAACIAGREGRVSSARVGRLKRRLTELDSGFIQEAVLPRIEPGRNACRPANNRSLS